MSGMKVKKNISSIKIIFSNTKHLPRFELLSRKISYGAEPHMNFVSK